MEIYTIEEFNCLAPHSTWYDEERRTFRCEQCGYEIRLDGYSMTVMVTGRQCFVLLSTGSSVLASFRHRGSVGGVRIGGVAVGTS